MSGMAEILLGLGFRVSGSDLKMSPICARLVCLGAEVFEGHHENNLPETASLLVYSSALNFDNPEIKEASRRGIPVVRRAEVLAELMRLKFGVGVAGSHGKTTTTTMIGHVMECGGLDPTVIVGGQVKSIGSGARLGKGAYLVAESDESDRSFLLLRPTIAVITNIDHEHMNAYDSFDDLLRSFEQFADSVPFYGLAVLCIDDPRLKDLALKHRGRVVTYGFSEEADIRGEDVRIENGASTCRLVLPDGETGTINLPAPGRHLLQNALAAVAVGNEFGLSLQSIADSLKSFPGVKRRLEVLNSAHGVTVISDYGHHPTEIVATIQAVRDGWSGRLKTLHVVFQPHRFSRTRDCFEGFKTAFHGSDKLYISDIYPAGEKPIEGVNSRTLCDALDGVEGRYLSSLETVPQLLSDELESGDVVLFLGAGSIGAVAESFAQYWSDNATGSHRNSVAAG